MVEMVFKSIKREHLTRYTLRSVRYEKLSACYVFTDYFGDLPDIYVEVKFFALLSIPFVMAFTKEPDYYFSSRGRKLIEKLTERLAQNLKSLMEGKRNNVVIYR